MEFKNKTIKKVGRSKRALLNLITSFASQLTSVFMNIITLKLFIEVFGSEMNGILSTIAQILSYVALLEAGIGMASIQALYKPLADGNLIKINSILSATKNFYKRTGCYYTLIISIIAFIFPYFSNTKIDHLKISFLIIIMSVPSLIEFFIQGKMRVLITASQKLYIINLFNIIGFITSGIMRIFSLKSGYDILIIQLIYSLVSVLKVVLLGIYFRKKYCKINFNSNPDNKSLSKRWSALTHQLAGFVVNGTPLIIVSIFLGFKEASVYSIYSLVFSTTTNFMWMFSNSVTPGFGELLSEGNKESIKKTYLNFESIFYIILTITYTSLGILVIPFVRLYTKNVNDINYIDIRLLSLFIIVNVLNTLRIPSNNMINASGHFHNTRKQAIFEACLNLGCSLFFVNVIGIYGVLVGAIISFSYRTIDIILYNEKYIINGTIVCTVKRIVFNSIISLYLIFALNNLNIVIDTWKILICYVLLILFLITFTIILFNMIFDFKAVKENFIKLIKIINYRRGINNDKKVKA